MAIMIRRFPEVCCCLPCERQDDTWWCTAAGLESAHEGEGLAAAVAPSAFLGAEPCTILNQIAISLSNLFPFGGACLVHPK
ncbi:hypothetical protein EJB05_08849, partial [Eragrostis curvula]